MPSKTSKSINDYDSRDDDWYSVILENMPQDINETVILPTIHTRDQNGNKRLTEEGRY